MGFVQNRSMGDVRRHESDSWPHNMRVPAYDDFNDEMKGISEVGGEQFIWWSHEKSKIFEDAKIKGLNIMTGFTNSQKLSWMNNLIIVVEIDGSISSMKFKATGFEWK
jgi:hypothetical protein